MSNLSTGELLVARQGLSCFYAKARRHEPVNVVFFGTSVTTGAWPDHFMEQLRSRFPDTPFHVFNSSIGGTASDLGVFRTDRDVMACRPDLVFVEFCNDFGAGGTVEVARQIDGMFWQIRHARPDCDLVLVHVPRQTYAEELARGETPPHIVRQEEAAARHGVASVHAWRTLARHILGGQMTWSDYGGDIIHPTRQGHILLAELVAKGLTLMESIGTERSPLPAPLDESYARARLVPIASAEAGADQREHARRAWRERLDSGALTDAFPERVDYYRHWMAARMPDIWMFDKAGPALRHEFHGRLIGMHDLHGPDSGSIAVRIDGQPRGIFDRYLWAGKTIYRLSNGVLFARDLDDGPHTVEVALLDQPGPNGLPPVFMPGFWMESPPTDRSHVRAATGSKLVTE